MENEWDYLPNAKHIDTVLAHVKAQPLNWAKSWRATKDDIPDNIPAIALYAVNNDLAELVHILACDAANCIPACANNVALRDYVWGDVWNSARYAFLALIAYNDCAYLLDSTLDDLRVIIALSGDANPAAIMLLPAVVAMQSGSAILYELNTDQGRVVL